MKYNIILLLLLLYHLYPSVTAIPNTNGIKTISKYKYLHRRRTRPYATSTNHCSWQLRCAHNICQFICCPQINSYAVPKYVTDVAKLISASAESRRMFLTEVTRTCLEAIKKDKADSNQKMSSQLIQPPTNTNITGTKTIYSTSLSVNPTTKPVTPFFNTSGTTMKNRIEDGKPNQAVTLFVPVGVVEDLSKTQYLLCGEIKEEFYLKLLKQSITEIPFQELTKQVQDLAKNLEVRMCTLELTYKTLKDIILQRTKHSPNWIHLF